MPLKKVSMIMPCYNAAPYLDVMLDSIVRQTYNSIELIAVDDASVDNTIEKLMEWEDKFRQRGYELIIVKREKNGNVCAAINSGLTRYTGEYICFIDADDILHSDYVLSFVDALESDTSCDWAMCDMEVENYETNNTTYAKCPPVSLYRNDFFDILSARTPFHTCLVMARSDYFRKCVPKGKIFESRLTQEWSIMFPLSWNGNYLRVPETGYRYIRRPYSKSHWLYGDCESVVEHLDGLHKLAENVLSELPLNTGAQKTSEAALILHYELRKYNVYMNFKRIEDANRIADLLAVKIKEIMPFELVDGAAPGEEINLYVEYALDILLEAKTAPLLEMYKELREKILSAGGYIVYGTGGKSRYLLPALIEEFGLPIALWDSFTSGGSVCGVDVSKPDLEFATEEKRREIPVLIMIGNDNSAGEVISNLEAHGFETVYKSVNITKAFRGKEAKRRLLL